MTTISSTRTPMQLPPPVEDVEEGTASLDTHGLVIHRNVLAPDQVAALKERLIEQADMERRQDVALISNQSYTGKTWYGGADGALPAWQGVPMLINKGRVFIDIMLKHPLSHAYCKHAFQGLPYQLSASTGLIQRKGCEPMTIHADQQWLPFRTELPALLNFFFCLSDFEEDMGATRVVPGSHRDESPRLAYDPVKGSYCLEDVQTIPIICKAGDMFAWDSRLWHQSGASSSDKTRYSVGTVWGQHWVKPIDNFVQSLHDDVCRTMSAEELELVGFKVDAGGRFEPRFPGDRQSTNRLVPFIPELRPGGAAQAVPALGPRANVNTFTFSGQKK